MEDVLAECSKLVKPLTYVEPFNAKEQKQAFLQGRIRNPSFTYKELQYDPGHVADKVSGFSPTDDELGTLLENKREQLLLLNMLIVNRGDKDLVQEVTSDLYGQPNPELVSHAENLLKGIPPAEYTKDVPSGEVRNALQEALYEHGLGDWEAVFSNKRLTTVHPQEKQVTVCRDRQFAPNDPERMKAHEIGVHTLRAANGHQQPYWIFSSGLAGYLATEEGLSLYSEEITGTTNEEMMRDYAGRVLAVDSVCQGLDFRQTYERLKDYKFSDEQAWNLGVRAHRGGGFIKDHIYLQGLYKVKRFAEENGDFETLYVGKVGVEDYDMVSRLLEKGVLHKPGHIPKFLLSVDSD